MLLIFLNSIPYEIEEWIFKANNLELKDYIIKKETEKAYGICDDIDSQELIWLPKSQINIADE